MLINRRIYHVYPGKFREALKLMKQMREIARTECNKDFKILVPIYGAFGTIAIELEFADAAEQDKFSACWYPMLEAKGWIVAWFQFVLDGTSELWTDSREPEPFKQESTS